METFEVIQPGPLTTIQDLGRYGYQQYGVPPSGALDNYAFRIGNLLVGNQETAASLEITLFGCQLRVLQDTTVAVTGADLGATLNGNPISMWESIPVRRGDIISFPLPKSGCRAYLALTGGINVHLVMSSAATYTRASIGGLEGRALRKGDILQTGKPVPAPKRARVPSEYIPLYQQQIELRVILGPQDNCFTEDGIRTFLQSEYTVSTQADRMGFRLVGPKIQHRETADIISDGIPLGAVQVPGDGLPIILLADRQTTGGYTKIATAISVDISKLAQAKPDYKVRFRQVSEDEALIALQEYEQKINTVGRLLRDTNH
jgi:antagonist of KipI